MANLRFVASATMILSAALMYSACSDSDAGTPESGGGTSNLAGESSGGSPADSGSSGAGGTDSAGQTSEGGSGGEVTAGAGGATTMDEAGAAGGGSTPLPEGPCTYATTGGATLPPAAAQFICTATSRVFQNDGEGDYSALFGGGFFLDGSNDSSTLACSVSSAVPPAAGDSWEIGADHPGNCELSNQEGATTNLWKASNQPAMGSATIEFVSATLTHGSTDPSDVYYLCTIRLTGTLVGETGAGDVDISGTFEVKLPLGA